MSFFTEKKRLPCDPLLDVYLTNICKQVLYYVTFGLLDLLTMHFLVCNYDSDTILSLYLTSTYHQFTN